jgi:transcriptional regulator with XRE-family HTH domain
MGAIHEKLMALSGGYTSTWSEDADYRLKNHKWLRYSGSVAIRALAAMEDKEGMTQKQLAEIMGVSPQQINKILKGHENLTLESIAKLSEALGVELISFPEFKYSAPSRPAAPARPKKTVAANQKTAPAKKPKKARKRSLKKQP